MVQMTGNNMEQQFDQILQNLMSSDNEIRSEAENLYENVAANSRLQLLLVTIQDSSKSAEVRSLSCVLLRRLFTNDFDELWASLAAEHQAAVKQSLLTCIRSETEPAVRRKICDATSELCRNLIDEDATNHWVDILHFLFECIQSDSSGLKEGALHIFSSVPGIFGNQQGQHLENIKQMLLTCLRAEPEVSFAATKAATSFLVCNEGDQQLLVFFRDLLPGIVNAVGMSVQQQKEDTLMKCLVDLAENTPKYMRPQLDNILDMCLKILANKELDNTWRQLALEVVTTLSETAAAMVRKHSKFIAPLVQLVLQLMCDLEEEDDWSHQDEVDEDEADDNAAAGESALDRLACGLGGKTMLPHILHNVPSLLASPEWQCRHAALMAVSACGEGCHKQMESMLGVMVEKILPFTSDEHPRVRYAACNALGQLSTDFQPTLQKAYHEKVLPALLTVLDDNGNPRVQAHAGAALVNFCEECPKQILSLYLDRIISKLAEVLNNKFNELVQQGNKLVLEQIVTTLATVADTAEDRFITYYEQFMPSLKVIIQNAVQPELKTLRGKTIECVSLIGLAVGREKFMQDCGDVMSLLLASQTGQEFADDDPQVSYLISAWARMCKILGKDFEQYLPMVMPPVLKAASIKPEVAVLDSDEMKALENDNDWQFVTLGDSQNFGIRTAGLEDKATACQMLVCYARELKEGFAPYTQHVLEIMVPLLKFYFHDECRVAAAECLPYLIDCAQIQGAEFVSNMWNFILPALLSAIQAEPEKDIQAEIMSSVAQCIERIGKNSMGEGHMADLITIMDNMLEEHFKRQEERHEQRKDEDYDEVVEENLLDEDDEDVYVLSKISDIIHALFGTMHDEFLPNFDKLIHHFVRLLKPDSPWSDRQWGLCLFDDVVEFSGPHSLKYQEYFVRPLLTSLTDSRPEVRQAAAYGVGVMAQFSGGVYNDVLKESLPLLVSVIQAGEARSLENINATENCISAITKICKYTQGVVDPNEIIPIWRTWLPVWEDLDEAVHIYGYFCDLFESQHPGLLGENCANLPSLVSIIAQCFSIEVADRGSELHNRLKALIVNLQSNAEVLGACVDQLQPAHKEALYREMNS